MVIAWSEEVEVQERAKDKSLAESSLGGRDGRIPSFGSWCRCFASVRRFVVAVLVVVVVVIAVAVVVVVGFCEGLSIVLGLYQQTNACFASKAAL